MVLPKHSQVLQRVFTQDKHLEECTFSKILFNMFFELNRQLGGGYVRMMRCLMRNCHLAILEARIEREHPTHAIYKKHEHIETFIKRHFCQY